MTNQHCLKKQPPVKSHGVCVCVGVGDVCMDVTANRVHSNCRCWDM